MPPKRRPELQLQSLLEDVDSTTNSDDEEVASVDGYFSDGASDYSSVSLDSADDTDIYGDAIARLGSCDDVNITNEGGEVDAIFASESPNFDVELAEADEGEMNPDQHSSDPPPRPIDDATLETPTNANMGAGGANNEGTTHDLATVDGCEAANNMQHKEGGGEAEQQLAPIGTQNMTISAPDDADYKPPRGRSIAHQYYEGKRAVFISLDIETGGDAVGIIQLSAEICRAEILPSGSSVSKDTLGALERNGITFDAYVNPGDGMAEYWSPAAMNTHGIRPEHDRIKSAKGIAEVWADFVVWIADNVPNNEVATLVAWNGATCDMKAIWKLTQAPGSNLSLPNNIRFYIDPYRGIDRYTGCPLHPKKSKLDSLSLGVVWKHIKGANLNGAHNSLTDAKAQMDVLLSEQFIPFVNRTNTVQLIDDIFSKSQQAEYKKEMESVREVHKPWVEQTEEQSIEWQPEESDMYTGPEGGAPFGPTSKMEKVAKDCDMKGSTGIDAVAAMFLAILPWEFFEKVSKLTDKYCYKDWVFEKICNDRDGKRKKRPTLFDCNQRTSGARHRTAKEKRTYKISGSFILAWIAICIIQGGHFHGKQGIIY